LERVEAWPHETRDELLRSITEIEKRYGNVYRATKDDRAALARSAQDVRKGRYATDQDVEKTFGRFHRA
jgi:hypothetical protein